MPVQHPQPTLTHYGLIIFGGDPAAEHPDSELRGREPHFTFICCGPEHFCWQSLSLYIEQHPLREWEHAEVMARDPVLVKDPLRRRR